MIKIYTFAHKRPDFIELQLKSFQKKLKDDFEFIIFNNAAFDIDKKQYNEINNICKELNLQCIDVKKDEVLIKHLRSYNNEMLFNQYGMYFNAVVACAYPLCWAWRNILAHMNDKICIIDSDMFMVQEESMCDILDEFDLIYQEQSRVDGKVYYMWNGLVFMNLVKIHNKQELDWWCGYCEGFPVDVGGQTYHYLKKWKDQLKIGGLIQHYIGEDPECDFSPANYEHFDFGKNGRVTHFRGGSNWQGSSEDYIVRKTKWLKTKI